MNLICILMTAYLVTYDLPSGDYSIATEYLDKEDAPACKLQQSVYILESEDIASAVYERLSTYIKQGNKEDKLFVLEITHNLYYNNGESKGIEYLKKNFPLTDVESAIRTLLTRNV